MKNNNEQMAMVNKEVASLLNKFKENPTEFDENPVKSLLLERLDLLEKQKTFIEKVKELHKQLENSTKEFMELQGVIKYLDEKIIKQVKQ